MNSNGSGRIGEREEVRTVEGDEHWSWSCRWISIGNVSKRTRKSRWTRSYWFARDRDVA